jgi:hypothetical protein
MRPQGWTEWKGMERIRGIAASLKESCSGIDVVVHGSAL